MTRKIPKYKHQITNKFQISISNDRNQGLVNSDSNSNREFLFGISNFGHCDLFDICDLVLGILFILIHGI